MRQRERSRQARRKWQKLIYEQARSGQSVGETALGTCEKIGFADFRTSHFQCFTLLIMGPNSIFSHVPGTLSSAHLRSMISWTRLPLLRVNLGI